jgi:hypothetical protein
LTRTRVRAGVCTFDIRGKGTGQNWCRPLRIEWRQLYEKNVSTHETGYEVLKIGPFVGLGGRQGRDLRIPSEEHVKHARTKQGHAGWGLCSRRTSDFDMPTSLRFVQLSIIEFWAKRQLCKISPSRGSDNAYHEKPDNLIDSSQPRWYILYFPIYDFSAKPRNICRFVCEIL